MPLIASLKSYHGLILSIETVQVLAIHSALEHFVFHLHTVPNIFPSVQCKPPLRAVG